MRVYEIRNQLQELGEVTRKQLLIVLNALLEELVNFTSSKLHHLMSFGR